MARVFEATHLRDKKRSTRLSATFLIKNKLSTLTGKPRQFIYKLNGCTKEFLLNWQWGRSAVLPLLLSLSVRYCISCLVFTSATQAGNWHFYFCLLAASADIGETLKLWGLCFFWARAPHAHLNTFSRQLTESLMHVSRRQAPRGAEPVQFFIRIKSLPLSRWARPLSGIGSRWCFRCGTRCALTYKQGLEELPQLSQLNVDDRCTIHRFAAAFA